MTSAGRSWKVTVRSFSIETNNEVSILLVDSRCLGGVFLAEEFRESSHLYLMDIVDAEPAGYTGKNSDSSAVGLDPFLKLFKRL